MAIFMVNVADLSGTLLRVQNTTAYEQLRKEIKRDGIQNPLLVRLLKDDGYEIVDGVQRYLVAKELGLLNVPCIEITPQIRNLMQN